MREKSAAVPFPTTMAMIAGSSTRRALISSAGLVASGASPWLNSASARATSSLT